MSIYRIGLLLGINSGISHYSGIIIEKIIINRLTSDVKLMMNLVKTPLWLFALILQFGFGTIFFILAQTIIGPALVYSLIAYGLIVLAIRSVKILGEKLSSLELISIILYMVAIAFVLISSFVFGKSKLRLIS